MSAHTNGHVGLVYARQRLLDREQIAVQAVSDDPVEGLYCSPPDRAAWENNRRERANGQARVVEGLRHRRALRAGLDDRRALDIVYALMSPELHRVLTVDRGWSDHTYEQWLGDTLCATLLADAG